MNDEPQDSRAGGIGTSIPSGPPVPRHYLALFQEGWPDDRFGTLNRELVYYIQQQIADAPPSGDTDIDVWLESPGGDANAAYKLLLELRHHYRFLRVVVPDYAKSAATLFAFGADSVLMAPAAELGPIDAQLEHPDREDVTISALDLANSLEFLGSLAQKYLIDGADEIVAKTRLPRSEALRRFSRFAGLLFEPMMAKFDPLRIHRAANDLDIAKQYALKVMPSGENLPYRGPPEKIVTHWVEHYPAHSFVISRQEAAQWGLPVDAAEKYDKLEKLNALHWAFRHRFFINRDKGENHFIELLDEDRLGEMPNFKAIHFGLDNGNGEADEENGDSNGNDDPQL